MTSPRSVWHRPQKGVALLVVLWGCTLAAITLGALASQARVEGLQTQGQTRRTEALYAAQAGIDQAVYRIRAKEPMSGWQADGRPYAMDVGDAQVVVAVSDEDGKINLNLASPQRIEALFRAAGADDAQLAVARKAIKAWASEDTLKSLSMTGLPQGGFASIEELYRVPGLPTALVDRIEPSLSLWSPEDPNLAHASELTVSAVTGASAEASRDFVARVRAMSPTDSSFPPMPGTSPGSVARTVSGTYTIDSKATVKGGQSITLRVTIGLISEPGDPRAYRVLRWRELSSAGEG